MSAPINNGPYRILTFKDFVPEKLRFLILLLGAIIFQFYGGIYLASVTQMVGGKVLLQEDVMMAGYATFIGMTMVFPLLFRIKVRFTSRSILLTVVVVLAACNVITMYSQNIFVLVAVSFVAGLMRMVGTFECFSTIQLKITPIRDMTVFFSVIYTIILGAIQLSGIMTVYLDYFFTWQYMHVAMVGLLMLFGVVVFFLMKDIRLMKKIPLKGIDWTGMIIWAVFLLSTVFVLQYGMHLDWFDSAYIRVGSVIAAVSLLLGIRQMTTSENPYISPVIFKYKNYKSGLVFMFILILMLSTPNAIQKAFTGGVLHYDSLNAISLNWLILAGVIFGTISSWYFLGMKKVDYKVMMFLGFTCLTVYQGMMYFLLDPTVNIESLFLPSFLNGAGYGILYVTLTLYSTDEIPFEHFFQSLSVMGFIRTGFGSVLAASLIANWLLRLVKSSIIVISSELDAVNQIAATTPVSKLIMDINQQATLVSMKEVFGWFTILGIVALLVIAAMPYSRLIFKRADA